MKDVFYELISEAKDGQIVIDGQVWPIGFNTFIYKDSSLIKTYKNDNNISCLIIKDEEKFFDCLREYIEKEINKNRKHIYIFEDKERNHMKLLISYLMVNATTEDFLNPIQYINRCIDFLEDDTFDYLNEGITLPLDGVFTDCKLRIKNSRQSIMMETPEKMELAIVKDSDNGILEYSLPTVSYGISNENGRNVCYVYSLLNPKEKENMTEEEIKFSKKIGRLLYKINSGIEEDDEEQLFDISKVSPSAVLSLTTFLSLLYSEDIFDVKAVPYLPLRYLSRDIAARKDGINDALLERNQMIQNNITNRFIRTFLRASHHLESAEVTLFPYQLDEFLHFKLGSGLESDNVVLNEAVSSVKRNL